MAKADLSMAFGMLSGKAGTVVLVRGKGGTFLRAKPSIRPALSERQQAAAARMTRAAAVWRGMTWEQAQAWTAYAESMWHGQGPAAAAGMNAFVGLATVTLMVDAEAEVAVWPPTEAFWGESWGVTASAWVGNPSPQPSPHHRSDRERGTEVLIPRPHSLADVEVSPKGGNPHSQAGAEVSPRGGDGGGGHSPQPSPHRVGDGGRVNGVRFVAGGANSVGVVTELLVQRLKSPLRTPGAAYVSAGFVTFVAPGQGFDLALEPGTYVVAYRFVKVATGQASERWLIEGRFTVG